MPSLYSAPLPPTTTTTASPIISLADRGLLFPYFDPRSSGTSLHRLSFTRPHIHPSCATLVTPSQSLLFQGLNLLTKMVPVIHHVFISETILDLQLLIFCGQYFFDGSLCSCSAFCTQNGCLCNPGRRQRFATNENCLPELEQFLNFRGSKKQQRVKV